MSDGVVLLVRDCAPPGRVPTRGAGDSPRSSVTEEDVHDVEGMIDLACSIASTTSRRRGPGLHSAGSSTSAA
jgi:hypothetical protein